MKINTAQAILYSTLIFAVSSNMCDKPGMCKGKGLKEVHAHDSFNCWKQCLSYDGCKYASFAFPQRPGYCHDSRCVFFRECSGLDDHDEACDWITSSRNCAHCDFTGLCIVSTNLANSG